MVTGSFIQNYAHIGTGVTITTLVFAVLGLLGQRDRRVDHRIRTLEAGDEKHLRPETFRDRWLRRLAPKSSESSAVLETRLTRAGLQGAAATSMFTAVQLLMAGSGAFFGLWLAQSLPPRLVDDLLGMLLGGCIGFLVPGYFLQRRARRRQQLVQAGLSDFLDLLVTCLDAGLSLEASLQRISDELQLAHPLLGSEMLRVQRDIELGATTDRALQCFAERSDIDVLRTLASACGQARRFGCRLSQTLRGMSDSLRQQREQKAEEAAQIAAVKILLPTLLLLFPIIFVVLAGPAAIQIVEQFSKAGIANEE